LGDNDKKTLNVAALMGKFTLYEIFPVVQQLIATKQKNVKECLTGAAEQGLFSVIKSSDFSASISFMIHVYPSLGGYESTFRHIQQNLRPRFYRDYGEVYGNIREALFYLLFGDVRQYKAAEGQLERFGTKNLYEGIIVDPQYRHVLSRISPNVLEAAVKSKYNEYLLDMHPLSGFRKLLGEIKSVLHDLKCLQEYDTGFESVLRGDFSAADVSSKGRNTYEFKAIELTLQGRHLEALEMFDKSLTPQRRTRKSFRPPDSLFAGYYCIVNLMCLEFELSLPPFRKIADANTKTEHSSTEIFRSVANYMLNDKEMMNGDLKSFADSFHSVSPMIAIHIFLAAKLCNSSVMDSEKYLPLVKQLVETAFDAGYTLIAHEAAYALNAAAPSLGAKLLNRISAKMQYPPAMSRIRRQEEWERMLDMLLDFRPVKKSSAPEEGASRVIYLFSPQYRNIQPVLQTRNARGWTAGRNIAIKTFAEAKTEGMTPADIAVAKTITVSFSNGYSYSHFSNKVFLALVGHPLIFLNATNGEIPVEFVEAKPQVGVIKSENKYVLISEELDERELESQIVVKKETNTRYRVISITDSQRKIIRVLLDGKITVPESGRVKLMELLAYMSAEDMEVHSDLAAESSEDNKVIDIDADARIRVQLLPFGNSLKAELFCKPFGNTPPYCKPGKGGRILIYTDNDTRLQAKRDFDTEKKHEAILMNDIQSLDAIEISDDGMMTFDEPEDSLHLLDILNRHLDLCVVEWPEGERFRLKAAADFRALNIEISSNQNWFELQGELRVDEDTVLSIMELLSMSAKSRGRFIELSSGEFIALSKDLKKRLDDLRLLSISDKNGVRINKFASVALNNFFDGVEHLKGDKVWRDFTGRVRKSAPKDFVVPAALQAELRPYQEDGFRWMARLAEWEGGACLADDMGLGKTIQTLTLLLHRAGKGAALVVCPVSVVGNWLNEAARFVPSLHAKTLGTTNREQTVAELQAGDLLVTSYGLLQSEERLFASREFATVVLDEAHAIKNFATKTSKATMNLRASFRVALTGTPIQNRLNEIWNIFNFLNPGLLGGIERFNDMFVKPDDESARKRLKKLLSPFILRRTKSKVLDELPPKIEIIRKIALSDEEAAFYEALRRNAVENISNADVKSAQMRVLAEITRLRQACCNPVLADPAAANMESSKLNAFLKIADELIENSHRALVFSQFVTHLSIVRKALDNKSVAYQYLDGSTSQAERERQVKQFQSGSAPLFLISLKAGGLGLNLTAADYVIHLDPWWNPAVEDQASDRAHRIGQTRPVTIYRLVTENTIEEKIIQLHNTKRDLAESLLEGSDRSASLSIDEMMKLIMNVK
jgi:superfamily II DNA or RNA helicase